MDPSRKADCFADITDAQSSAAMGTIGVHEEFDPLAENVVKKSRRASLW
jgi:AMMECR1 domain-containing protein